MFWGLKGKFVLMLPLIVKVVFWSFNPLGVRPVLLLPLIPEFRISEWCVWWWCKWGFKVLLCVVVMNWSGFKKVSDVVLVEAIPLEQEFPLVDGTISQWWWDPKLLLFPENYFK